MSPTSTFSYDFDANPSVAYPRLLISDTDSSNFIFNDTEILAAVNLCTFNFQSAQFYSPPGGRNLPSSPIPYLRVAAILLDCIAANKSRLASITRILDVELDPSRAARFLRDQAKAYRETDDNAGSFMVIEQVNNDWSLVSRYTKQIQRQQGLGF